MPYKGLESFKIKESCVREWAQDLNFSTAKNYIYYFQKYLEWATRKKYWRSAQELLDDYSKLEDKEQFKHLDRLKEYIKFKGTGSTDKRNNLFAVRSFYEYHRSPLPRLSKSEATRLLKLSDSDKKRAMELAPLKLEEVRELILNMQDPYRSILTVMLQSAMGLAEFIQFNQRGWRRIVDNLDKEGPVRVDLYRSKTSKKIVKKYYTFIGTDAKKQIKQWLQKRPDVKVEDLFLTYNKNRKKWVPVTAPRIGDAVTRTAKKLGLIQSSQLGRYHIHAHELRDLFKSLCTLNGVNQVSSELFLGHAVDKLGYDKSPEYDEEWFRNEYRKVESQLNVISNPKRRSEEDLNLAFKKQLLLVAGYSKQEIEKIKITDMDDDELRDEIRKKILGIMANNGKQQKVIPLNKVEKYLGEGWEYVTDLPKERAIVKLAS